MSPDRVFDIVNKVPNPWNVMIWYALLLGALAYLASKTFKFVPQGYNALRTRWKKVVFKNGEPVVLGPGLHIMWPWMHGLELESILDRPIGLLPIRLQISPYLVVDISATATFAVHEIYKILYATDNFEARLTAGCEAHLRIALSEITNAKLEAAEQVYIDETFKEMIAPLAEELGVELKELHITNVAPDAQFAIAGAIKEHGTSVEENLS